MFKHGRMVKVRRGGAKSWGPVVACAFTSEYKGDGGMVWRQLRKNGGGGSAWRSSLTTAYSHVEETLESRQWGSKHKLLGKHSNLGWVGKDTGISHTS